MKNKEECNLIMDILPNYVDKLTSKDTNNFVEIHVKECEKCSKFLKNLQKDFEKENEKIKKEVKYAKKYNRKIKSLIFVIVAILIFLFSITFLRNLIIVKNLSRKALASEKRNNFHIIWSTHTYEETTIFDIYYKDGKYLEKLFLSNYQSLDGDNVTKLIKYYDGGNKVANYFLEDKILQYQEIDEDNKYPTLRPQNISHILMHEENLILLSFRMFITTQKCNNRDCYRLRFNDEFSTYIDKETGLTLRSENGISYSNKYYDTISDIICEFDVVKDEDIIMPSIEGYTIQQ